MLRLFKENKWAGLSHFLDATKSHVCAVVSQPGASCYAVAVQHSPSVLMPQNIYCLKLLELYHENSTQDMVLEEIILSTTSFSGSAADFMGSMSLTLVIATSSGISGGRWIRRMVEIPCLIVCSPMPPWTQNKRPATSAAKGNKPKIRSHANHTNAVVIRLRTARPSMKKCAWKVQP